MTMKMLTNLMTMLFECFYTACQFLVPSCLVYLFLEHMSVKMRSWLVNRRGLHHSRFWGGVQFISDDVRRMIAGYFLDQDRSFLQVFHYMFASSYVFCLVYNYMYIKNYSTSALNEAISLAIVQYVWLSTSNAYILVAAGWAGYNRFYFLGSLRAAAQMIYHDLLLLYLLVHVGLVCKCCCCRNSSFVFIADVLYEYLWVPFICLPLLFLCLIYFVLYNFTTYPYEDNAVSLQTQHHIVISFVLVFLLECGIIIFAHYFSVILFLGGWSISLPIKTKFAIFLITCLYRTSSLSITLWGNVTFKPKVFYLQFAVGLWIMAYCSLFFWIPAV